MHATNSIFADRLFVPLMRAVLHVVLALGPWLVPAPSQASVVIEATRVVYSAAVAQREVRISNEDDFPNLVQVWVDSGDPESKPDAHDERFFITPPVFRMEPKSGQSLRLRYLENDLPKDRESLFYLNVLQVPPVSSDQQDNNKVLVMIRNRLKLFYRPETIHADPATAGDAIEFQIQKRDLGYVLVASNPSPFFITLTGLKLSSETADYTVDSRMVAPFARQMWMVDDPEVTDQGEISIRYQWIDDYGAGRPRTANVQR